MGVNRTVRVALRRLGNGLGSKTRLNLVKGAGRRGVVESLPRTGEAERFLPFHFSRVTLKFESHTKAQWHEEEDF
jgi:hypothetical protein